MNMKSIDCVYIGTSLILAIISVAASIKVCIDYVSFKCDFVYGLLFFYILLTLFFLMSAYRCLKGVENGR